VLIAADLKFLRLAAEANPGAATLARLNSPSFVYRELAKDIDPPVFIYLGHLSSRSCGNYTATAALSRAYSEVVRRLSTQRHLMLTPSFCTGCHPIFLTHSARIPAFRRSAFIFPSQNSASTTPSARFVGSSPFAALTVQATPSRATCFFVRSMRTSSAK
jgi:hypothetical protein